MRSTIESDQTSVELFVRMSVVGFEVPLLGSSGAASDQGRIAQLVLELDK